MAVDHTLTPAEEEDETVVERRFTGRQKFGFVVGGVLLAGTVFGAHWLLSGSGEKDAARRPQLASIGLPFAEPKPPPTPALQPAVALAPGPALPALPVERIVPQIPRQADPGMTSRIAAVSAPVSDRGGSGGRHGADGADDSDGPDGTHDALSKSLVPSDVGKTTYAELLKDPDYTIPAGTLIHCVLDTAINSQLLGFTRCHIPAKEGVWNATGTGIMLDAGTTIVGQIQRGLLQGQNRLFVLWTIARTPNQVKAQLNSPAADDLGRSGIPGTVDNHYWSRLFNTAVYSFVGYGPQIVSSALQNRTGNNNNYLSLITPQQNLAETILNQEINIPPTLEANQGDPVTIFVGHDINFSKVYRFRTINGRRVLSGE
jgi:type IV secretion system protein VirB10